MRNQTILVDINKETCKILKYKQYDNNNILQIIVEENYKKINLNEYVGFAFFELPSGLIIKKECEIEDNVITIIIDNNVLSEKGKVLLDLTLSDGEDIFTLFRINLVIEETIDREEAIIIEAGWDIVAEIAKFDKAEEQRVADEERRVDYESVRITNESDRQNEETKRIANENVRVVKESERLINEQGRVTSEELRIENEDERIANEEGRVQAEASRVTAEEERVTRFNEMEATVAEFETDITEIQNDITEIQNDASEIQNDVSEIQDDMDNAQTQTYSVTDAYKFAVDHDGMMSSLVTLNNIEGLSSVETNDRSQKLLVPTNIGTICTIDINGKNYAEDIVCLETPYGSECVIDGTNITIRRNTPYTDDITSHAFGSMSIPTLEDGKKYCVFCDDVEISNGGASAIEVQSEHNTFTFGDNWNSLFLDNRVFNSVFIYDSKSFIMRLHCTVGSEVGEVTYKNLQIYEVKEIIVPDIQLNSLPNGVKDEIKDGTLIKRTDHIVLSELQWMASSGNESNPDSEFVVFYASSPKPMRLPADVYDETPIIYTNMLSCKSPMHTTDLTDNNVVCISGHPNHSEFRIKARRSLCPNPDAMTNWLVTYAVDAVYELETSECVPVDLTIKADKGDTAVINTTKTMDFTYDIQLNTRAQIDALLKQNTSALAGTLKEAMNKIEQLEARIQELENK